MLCSPLPIAALLLLAPLALIPLVWSLCRKGDQVQAERRRWLRHAMTASELERRRIARDLHDDVLQELSGVGYALTAASRSLPPTLEVPRQLVDDASRLVQHVGESLRSLMVETYPPNLVQDGLASALAELAARAETRGLVVELSVDVPDDLELDVQQLAYRVVSEALRNVVRHARASSAWVQVEARQPVASIQVLDDGVGPGDRAKTDGDHLGLRLLQDTLCDVGGHLVVRPRAGGGTDLSATVPLTMQLP